MYLKNLLRFNAVLYIAGGIAFALYSPLMIAMYGILETGGSPDMYWYTASFARLYGAALFGFGFLAWATSHTLAEVSQNRTTRRWIALSMLFANGMGLFVAITQQVSIWGSIMGWIMVAFYAVLLLGYIYILVAG